MCAHHWELNDKSRFLIYKNSGAEAWKCVHFRIFCLNIALKMQLLSTIMLIPLLVPLRLKTSRHFMMSHIKAPPTWTQHPTTENSHLYLTFCNMGPLNRAKEKKRELVLLHQSVTVWGTIHFCWEHVSAEERESKKKGISVSEQMENSRRNCLPGTWCQILFRNGFLSTSGQRTQTNTAAGKIQ